MKMILKVIGWILIPYIMIFIFWKELSRGWRIAASIYSAIFLWDFVHIYTGGNNGAVSTQTTAPSPTINAAPSATVPADNNKQTTKPDTTAPAPAPAQVQIQEGTYQVGTDIQPGLYRTDGGMTYWARLKGLTGDLSDIIANSDPVGPDVVEILPTDKAFETNGSGYWTKIDDNYHPQMVTSFGDGTYIVGKDIAPGTYKSDGGGYWARLSGFTGDMGQIIANSDPQGPAIVQILPTDKGFQTSRNGTWTKIQ